MAESESLGVVCYSPLGAGLLTGKYTSKGAVGRITGNDFYRVRYDDPDYSETARKFCEYCRSRDWHPATVAVAWVSSHPAVTAPIIGARNLEQLDPSLAAANFKMTPELRAEISALSKTPPLATDRRDEQFGMKIH